MAQATDADEFEDRWNSYVDDFSRLRLAASGEDFDRLAEIQTELREIVKRTAEEHREEGEDQ